MMPTYASRGGRRRYHYLCLKDDRGAVPECPVRQVPARNIEELEKKHIRKTLGGISQGMQKESLTGRKMFRMTEPI